jgi:hypothetical protein
VTADHQEPEDFDLSGDGMWKVPDGVQFGWTPRGVQLAAAYAALPVTWAGIILMAASAISSNKNHDYFEWGVLGAILSVTGAVIYLVTLLAMKRA